MIKHLISTIGLALSVGTALADGPHKQTAPVDLERTIHGTPHNGQRLAIDVTVTPLVDVTALHLSFVADAGLYLGAADSQQSFGAIAAGQSRTVSLEVTPQATGLQRLSVIAEVGGVVNGATRRTWTIELPVDVTSEALNKSGLRPVAVDATGQKIESMHGAAR